MWYSLESSCERFNSIISAPVPLPVRNLCRTSWNWSLALRQVSMSASTTLQRASSSPMPRVSVVPLGMRNRTDLSCSPHVLNDFHPFEFSPGYASRSHCLKCSVQEVGVSTCFKWAHVTDHYIHLRLRWCCIVHLERLHVCCQG